MRVCKCVHSATEMSVTANSKNHPTQQSAAALPIKRYAAAYGVHPLDRPARSPRRPPSIHSSRQTQPHPAPRRPKRKFLSKSAARQKMRASEHGWAALRSTTFRAIDRTTYAIGKRGDDVPLRISPRTPRSVSKDTATRQKNEGVRSWMGGPTLSYPSTTPFRSRKTKLELALRFLRRVK